MDNNSEEEEEDDPDYRDELSYSYLYYINSSGLIMPRGDLLRYDHMSHGLTMQAYDNPVRFYDMSDTALPYNILENYLDSVSPPFALMSDSAVQSNNTSNGAVPTVVSKPTHARGSLTVVVGPMFAGKTTDAVRTANCLCSCPQYNKVVWLHNKTDTRQNALVGRMVGTHNKPVGLSDECGVQTIPALSDARLDGATHIIMDEVQFYPADKVLELVIGDWVLRQGRHVYTYGLMSWWTGEMCPTTAVLISHATSVRVLAGVCSHCGKDATMTAKRNSDTDCPLIQVAGADTYMPLCLQCHSEHHVRDPE